MGTKNPGVDVHVSLDHAIEMLRMASQRGFGRVRLEGGNPL